MSPRGINSNEVTGEVKDKVGDVQSSAAYKWLVKLGLVAYGVVHILIGWLAAQIAMGSGGEEASNSGALAQVADAPAGEIFLWLIVVGLFTIAIWQLLEAITGHREFDDKKRLQKRISSAFRFIAYSAIAITAIGFLRGTSSSGGESTEQEVSEGLFGLPGGQLLVGAVGLGILGYGVYYLVKGIKRKFNEDLTRDLTGAADKVARVGCIAKGIAYGVMGGLFIFAAVKHEPEQAGGLDDAMSTIAEQPLGTFLLLAVAIGLACFGVYCFFWAKHAKVSQVR